MSAVKKLQNGTINKTLIAEALSKAWVGKHELSDFVSKRVSQRVIEELSGDHTLSTRSPQRAVKYVRATFKRILSEIEAPIAAISSEDTVVKICQDTSLGLVSKSITKQNRRVPYHYDEEFLTSMPAVATTKVLEAFRKDLTLPLTKRKYKSEAMIRNVFIKTLKNLHIDFIKHHKAIMRGSGREVLGSAQDAQSLDFGISSHEKVEANIHRENLITLLAETKAEQKSEADKKRISLLMYIVLGMDPKDAAKACNLLMRDAEIELEKAGKLIQKYDLLVEAFEDFRSVTENEYEDSLTAASNHSDGQVETMKAPKKTPAPCFQFKPTKTNKFNGTVTFWKGEQSFVLNCINQPSIPAAKTQLEKLMNGAE